MGGKTLQYFRDGMESVGKFDGGSTSKSKAELRFEFAAADVPLALTRGGFPV